MMNEPSQQAARTRIIPRSSLRLISISSLKTETPDRLVASVRSAGPDRSLQRERFRVVGRGVSASRRQQIAKAETNVACLGGYADFSQIEHNHTPDRVSPDGFLLPIFQTRPQAKPPTGVVQHTFRGRVCVRLVVSKSLVRCAALEEMRLMRPPPRPLPSNAPNAQHPSVSGSFCTKLPTRPRNYNV